MSKNSLFCHISSALVKLRLWWFSITQIRSFLSSIYCRYAQDCSLQNNNIASVLHVTQGKENSIIIKLLGYHGYVKYRSILHIHFSQLCRQLDLLSKWCKYSLFPSLRVTRLQVAVCEITDCEFVSTFPYQIILFKKSKHDLNIKS